LFEAEEGRVHPASILRWCCAARGRLGLGRASIKFATPTRAQVIQYPGLRRWWAIAITRISSA
jgi:hypothetical protein